MVGTTINNLNCILYFKRLSLSIWGTEDLQFSFYELFKHPRNTNIIFIAFFLSENLSWHFNFGCNYI